MEAGDGVRTQTGQTGAIVILNDTRTLAFVLLDEHEQSVRLTLCNVGDLVKLEEKN